MKTALLNNSIALTVNLALLAVSNSGLATVLYVDQNSTNSSPPFTNWLTAATNIQDAVDAAVAGDEVLVTDGVYAGGVHVDAPMVLASVKGAPSTTIDGGGWDRCVYLTDGASLTGFTLTNGMHSLADGGGVGCYSTNAFVTNCVITGCGGYGIGGVSGGTLYYCTLTSNSSALYGGGAGNSILYNCSLNGNAAGRTGGGAYLCTLCNCILSGNSGSEGGGASYCTLYNCRLTGNSCAQTGGGAVFSTLYNCAAISNSAAEAGGGVSISTLYNCTLAGNDGGWRAGGGAYASTLYNCIVYYNTAQTGENYDAPSALTNCCTTPLPPNGSANFTNPPLFVDYANGDFHLQPNSSCINSGNNAYVSNATDLGGSPRIASGTVDLGAYEFQPGGVNPFAAWLRCDGANVIVSWQSATGLNYFVECGTNLAAASFQCVATNLAGQADITSCIHTNAAGFGARFYRVGVEN